MRIIFGYGSMLSPDTHRRFLNDGNGELIPAILRGYKRTWNATVHYKEALNKVYLRNDEPVERFTWANVVPEQGVFVNGICRYVTDREFRAIDFREEGYQPIEVTERVEAYSGHKLREVPAFVFRNTNKNSPHNGKGAAIHKDYPEILRKGARHWSKSVPGFYDDYTKTTVALKAKKLPLTQVYLEPDGRELYRLNTSANTGVPLYCFKNRHFEPINEKVADLSPGIIYADDLFENYDTIDAIPDAKKKQFADKDWLHSLIVADEDPSLVQRSHPWFERLWA